MKIRKLKRKIRRLTILSFLSSIAPLIAVVALKWNNYISEPSDAVKLSIGGIIVVVLLFLKVIGKLKMPQKRIITYLFALILCYTLSTILDDIVFLLGMATIGELIDLIFFQYPLKKAKEKLQLEKTSDAVGDRLESIVQKYLGGTNNS